MADSPRKASTMRAIEKFLLRQDKPKVTSRKNKKPEKEVEFKVKCWLKRHQFSFDVIEAKNTYSSQSGRYTGSNVPSGFPDVCACDRNGFSVWIELKAPGKLSTLRGAQRVFLLDKIHHNAFACVCDSVDRLEFIYKRWLALRNSREFVSARNFLMNFIPPAAKIGSGDLFDMKPDKP